MQPQDLRVPKPPRSAGPATSAARVHRAVRLTARTSALLFAGAQVTSALGPRAARASRPLYLGFMAAHAVHFMVVSRFAIITGGRNLFPGGRSMHDVGGWATVLGIFAFFAGLAATGWAAGSPAAASRRGLRVAGRVATRVMGAMFVSPYLGRIVERLRTR